MHFAHASNDRAAETTGIPRAMVLRLIRGLLGAPSSLATVASAFVTQGLISASGDRDRTTSPSAAAAFVNCAAASIASRTNVRDDRETPLDWAGRAKYTHDFYFWKSELFSRAPLNAANMLERRVK
jgi:hypothetical protein